MTNVWATCSCFHKMNNVMKVAVITLIVMVISALLYFVLPQIVPSNFFVLFVMLPMALLGLLFGLALFGFAFGVNKLCEWFKRK